MDEEHFKSYFEVRKIRGRDADHIFKNYSSDLPRLNLETYLKKTFQNSNMKNKDDERSEQLREAGNLTYRIQDLDGSLKCYNKSLRFATYDSVNFAIASANRSAVFYLMCDYVNCLKDTNLCLEGNCPVIIKAKVLHRKSSCLQHMGLYTEMNNALKELQEFLDNTPSLSKELIESYKKQVNDLLKSGKTTKMQNYTLKIPELDENPNFVNASKSVGLKYNKQLGRYAVAIQDISQGQVLFVEKAFAFAPIFNRNSQKVVDKLNCQNCLILVRSFVPCKFCVKFVFCSSKCRDLAWDEFHQWECLAIRSHLFESMANAILAFRIVMKAAHTDFFVKSTNYQQDIKKYGDKNNMYTYVHHLCTHFDNMNKATAMKMSAVALILAEYLQQKTNFFTWLKERPAFSRLTDKDLYNQVGSLFLRHLAQFACNEFVVKGFDELQICRTEFGVATLPSMSMMSHSCIPNVSYYFIGNTAIVKALRKINTNEKICYAYMDLHYSTCQKVGRQMILAQMCSFKCRCAACTNVEYSAIDAYLCVKCNNAAVASSSDFLLFRTAYVCLSCNHKFELAQSVKDFETLFSQYLLRFKEKHDIEDAKRCIAMATSVVTPQHKLFDAVHLALLEYYIHQKADLRNFMKYVKLLINSGHKRYGEIAFENGIFIMQMCSKLANILDGVELKNLRSVLKDASEVLQEAKLIFNLYWPKFNDQVVKFQQLFKHRESLVSDMGGGGDNFKCICQYSDDSDIDDDDDDEFPMLRILFE